MCFFAATLDTPRTVLFSQHFSPCSGVIILVLCVPGPAALLVLLLFLHFHSSQWLCSSTFPALWLPGFHGSTDAVPRLQKLFGGSMGYAVPCSPHFAAPEVSAAPSVQLLWLPELFSSTGVVLRLLTLCWSNGAFILPVVQSWLH